MAIVEADLYVLHRGCSDIHNVIKSLPDRLYSVLGIESAREASHPNERGIAKQLLLVANFVNATLPMS